MVTPCPRWISLEGGPFYADRVNGKMTLRDWKHWTPDDRHEYFRIAHALRMPERPSFLARMRGHYRFYRRMGIARIDSLVFAWERVTNP